MNMEMAVNSWRWHHISWNIIAFSHFEKQKILFWGASLQNIGEGNFIAASLTWNTGMCTLMTYEDRLINLCYLYLYTLFRRCLPPPPSLSQYPIKQSTQLHLFPPLPRPISRAPDYSWLWNRYLFTYIHFFKVLKKINTQGSLPKQCKSLHIVPNIYSNYVINGCHLNNSHCFPLREFLPYFTD